MRSSVYRLMRLLPAFILVASLTLPALVASGNQSSGMNASTRQAISCGGLIATDDQDGDGLADQVETDITLTSPCMADTDGDGLLDPWEVRPGIPGAGFDLDGDGTSDISRDEVFGPYAEDGRPGTTDQTGRVSQPFADFVHPPDPLHKDLYFELDWQDCSIPGGNCPEPLRLNVDATHHAPDIGAISDVVAKFHNAPVTNPDGRGGINLHILVDESVIHIPNCDQGRAIAFN